MKSLNFNKENSLLSKNYKVVVGIDEAGRGSLAGPVTAAAIAFWPMKSRIKNNIELRILKRIKDSKKLTPKRREEFYEILTRHPRIFWAAASVGPGTIDKINVARAANLAAKRAFEKLLLKIQSAKISERPLTNFSRNSQRHPKIFILLDGSLYLPKILNSKFYFLNSQTIIRGDEKIWSIAAASVIAKVARDRKMRRLAKKFPGYDLEIHKGYGTKMHYQRIRKFGPSQIHRKSFL